MTIDNELAPPRFVDMPEICNRLSVQKSSVYVMFKNGDLTPVKLLPKKTVVLEEELSALIQRKFQEASQKVSA